ncbi:glycosyltransferase family 2 protein [Leuconostoc mesenteroides]|uniref:glycosyltransferase family 2 protein n=1 Tax=Leuconostoc mesenteroides TaxID=1245 RepID=UPI00235E97AF|nr:glycosyltransferase family 2 protein [Leuconostoc mesenteroides]
MKISIVIPMYNAGTTINLLLDDLENQVSKNFEVVIVDDFSRDNSVHIVEHRLDKMRNVNLIKQPQNFGRSVARNEGLRLVTGDYVVFIDSDDRVSKFFISDFEALYNANPNSDLLITGWTNNLSAMKNRDIKFEADVLSRFELLNRSFLDKRVYYSIWNKAFRVGAILQTNTLFQEFVYAEDLAFIVDFVVRTNNFNATVNFDQVDYTWQVYDGNHVGMGSKTETNAIFEQNYKSMKYVFRRLFESDIEEKQVLINSIRYITLQHYVHYPNFRNRREFLKDFGGALRTKVSIVSKLRLIFNYLFGIKIERVLYAIYVGIKGK